MTNPSSRDRKKGAPPDQGLEAVASGRDLHPSEAMITLTTTVQALIKTLESPYRGTATPEEIESMLASFDSPVVTEQFVVPELPAPPRIDGALPRFPRVLEVGGWGKRAHRALVLLERLVGAVEVLSGRRRYPRLRKTAADEEDTQEKVSDTDRAAARRAARRIGLVVKEK